MNRILVSGVKPGDERATTRIYYDSRVASNVTFEGRSVIVVYNQLGYHVYYAPFYAYFL